MQNFKPLLAGKVANTATLAYPLCASPKLDGIRAVNLGNGLLSRSLKLIPNKHVQKLFGGIDLKFFDGELICGDPTDKDCYRNTNSAVMKIEGTPDVKFYIFDYFANPDHGYKERILAITALYDDLLEAHPGLVIVPQCIVHHELELLQYEEKWLTAGYEGAMVRSMNGCYKYGRSTDKEGKLLKLKRFNDSEAVIIGFEELYSNQNLATKDALGHTERSSHSSGMVPQDTLGALIVQDLKTRVEFCIGTGFTAQDRQDIWDSQGMNIGSIVKYKSFAIGVKDKPRFPVFLGFRAEGDMS